MQIVFSDNADSTTWDLTAEEERLLESLRLRLLVEIPDPENPRARLTKPRFESIAEMIHTHLLDSLLLDQIRVETQEQVIAAANASVVQKRAELVDFKNLGKKAAPVLRADASPVSTPAPESTPAASTPGLMDRIKGFFVG